MFPHYLINGRIFWGGGGELVNTKCVLIFIVAPCILITLTFPSPTNAPLYYTYKMLKYTPTARHTVHTTA
jgi:hypothetical protein